MPRLPLVLVLVGLLAGCADPPAAQDGAIDGNATAPTDADPNAPTTPTPLPPSGIEEMRHASTERFALQADGTLGVLRDGTIAEARVLEPNPGYAFYASMAQEPSLMTWTSEPIRVPFEATQPFQIRISYVSDQPAAAMHPQQVISPIVGFFGTPERFAFFLGAPDAPAQLEAGKVYTTTFEVTPPPGGFFVRAGEPLALRTFLGYQSADGKAPSYVVGGADPAGFALPHEHFNLSAPRATVVLDESGETGPNPTLGSTADNTQPFDAAFEVPADAVYLVAELVGTPKAPERFDADLDIRTSSGESLGGGHGPSGSEIVVIGPGALAKARSLVAHVGSAGFSGGTVHVKVTAYSP